MLFCHSFHAVVSLPLTSLEVFRPMWAIDFQNFCINVMHFDLLGIQFNGLVKKHQTLASGYDICQLFLS